MFYKLACDFWELISNAPADGIDTKCKKDSEIDVQLDQRHLMLRGETLSKILKFRSILTKSFRDHYDDRGYYEGNFSNLFIKFCFIYLIFFI